MRIGVHALAAFKKKKTGVEEYAWQILKHLGEHKDASAHEWILYRPQSFAGQPSPHERFLIHDLPDSAFWTQRQLTRAMRNAPPDVLFIPAHVLPRETPDKTVVTVHGVEWERFPKAYSMRNREYLRWFTKEAVDRAHRIITPSASTKTDVAEFYKVPEEKIEVIPHGVHISDAAFPEGMYPTISAPYFLFLGRLERKKNIENIVKAFEVFLSQRPTAPSHKLVLAGPPGFGYETIEEALKNSPSRERIITMGYVSDATKWWLLKNAAALLLPSWYEGFGMPILEAQAVGTPVITSFSSSMPEVAGAGALYVNPASPVSITQAMHQITHEPLLREELIASGLGNVARFSWKDAAHRTLKALTE